MWKSKSSRLSYSLVESLHPLSMNRTIKGLLGFLGTEAIIYHIDSKILVEVLFN